MTTTELRELMARATPGPWMHNEYYEMAHNHNSNHPLKPIALYHSRNDIAKDDFALIVAAINALPALLEVADAAKAYAQHKWPTGQPNSSTVTFSMQLPELQERLCDAVAKLETTK